MEQTTYSQLETQHNGMKVILEFPIETTQEESIRQEIKAILTGVLQEQANCLSAEEESPLQTP